MAQFRSIISDGSTTQYTFSFDYISQAFVKVSINGVAAPFTFTDTYTINLNDVPDSGDRIYIYRETDSEPLVDFVDGSILLASDLDLTSLQATHIAEEARIIASLGATLDGNGLLDAKNRRVVNVANPIDPQDVATRVWVETGLTSQLNLAETAKTSAETAQGAAEAAQQVAELAASAAAIDAATAAAHKTAAQTAVQVAQAARDTATTRVTEATEARDLAEQHADDAREARAEILELSAAATGLAEGAAPTASYDPAQGILTFGIPQGAKGDKGNKGDTGTGITARGVVPTAGSLPGSGNTQGDAWVADDTKDMYVWVTGSGWKNFGNLQGPQGEDGPTDFNLLTNLPTEFNPTTHTHPEYMRYDAGGTMAGVLNIERAGQVALQFTNTNFSATDRTVLSMFNGSGNWFVRHAADGNVAIQADVAGAEMTTNTSIVTREKGDARYPLLEDTVDYKRIFPTLDDLINSDKIAVGEFVMTLGYLTPGDDGGNTYEIVAAGTGVADGGSFVDLVNITGQAKGLFGDTVRSAQFGATSAVSSADAIAPTALAEAYADATSTVTQFLDSRNFNSKSYRANKIDKGGNQVSFVGDGNFLIEVDETAGDPEPKSTLVLNDLWFDVGVGTNNVDGSQFRINQTGGAFLKCFGTGGRVSEFRINNTTLSSIMTDDLGEVSKLALDQGGKVNLTASSGDIRLLAADGISAAALPIDSDSGDMWLRIDPNGRIKRADPAAFRNGSGTVNPVDGNTIAFYVGQFYTNRTNKTIWVATAKSDNPDVSGVGSIWEQFI